MFIENYGSMIFVIVEEKRYEPDGSAIMTPPCSVGLFFISFIRFLLINRTFNKIVNYTALTKNIYVLIIIIIVMIIILKDTMLIHINLHYLH